MSAGTASDGRARADAGGAAWRERGSFMDAVRLGGTVAGAARASLLSSAEAELLAALGDSIRGRGRAAAESIVRRSCGGEAGEA